MSATAASPFAAGWPALSTALDAAAMVGHFDDTLRPMGRRVLGCEIERVKIRPPGSASVLYRLTLDDPGNGGGNGSGDGSGDGSDHGLGVTQRVATRLWRSEEAIRRATRIRSEVHAPSSAGPSVRLVPQLDMLSWWWPNDPKLDAPRVFEDEDTLQRSILPEVIARLSSGTGHLCSSCIELVQYVPEQRLTMRVDLGWRTASGRLHERRVFVRAAPPGPARRSHTILQAITASEPWQAGRLRTPSALLWQPEYGLGWQSNLEGITLASDSRGLSGSRAESLGQQLATLHALELPATLMLPRFDPLAIRRGLDKTVQLLHTASPDNGGRIERIADALRRGLHRLEDEPIATLHGDLHANNVLVDGERVGLIDFETLHLAPAVIELGGWIADAIGTAVHQARDPIRARASNMALLAAYARAGGRMPANALLSWSVAWSLIVTRARRAVINLKPGRFDSLSRLLEIAEQVVVESGEQVIA